MATELRKTGISVIGEMPWGTHFCHFHETKQDLLDTVLPYFKAGLENNEFCLWVTAESLTEEEARRGLQHAVPHFARYLAEQSIEILPYAEWYPKGGTFDPHRVITDWREKLDRALAGGYAGMRVAASTAWLQKKDRKDYRTFEIELNEALAHQRLIVLCACSLAASGAADILDVAQTHEVAVVRRNGDWEVVETPELKQAKAAIKRLNEELEQRVVERTRELAAANEELRKEIAERKRTEEALERAFQEIQVLKDQLYNENVALREEIDTAFMFEEIVGASPALQTVLAHVAKVAPTDSTVLITGETGTGKELIARAIHKRSPRSSHTFVSVNCAAIPPSLITSELFGHEKGAFTGALQRRLGRFELANGGTLFLDEIGELPAETQLALLRVLQEREFERVGGNQAIRADGRVIAATSRDLQAAMAAGAFRSDLFYRLSVFPLELPPLRDRKDDIPLLAQYFIDRYARKAGKKIRSINPKTLELLQAYSWPGNIRELQNVVERSVILCETETFTVDPSWLAGAWVSPQPAGRPPATRSPTQERKRIEAALAESRGRVSGPSGAAAKLGMPASTLESKIRALKINKYRFKTN